VGGPRGEALKDVPKEREEELKREIARGREEITRTILTEAQKIIPQYGIELVDVRIKRLDYVESVREKVYERMISERKRIAAQFRSEEKDAARRSSGQWKKSCARSAPKHTARYRRSRGKPTPMQLGFTARLTTKIPNSMPFCALLKATKRKQI
jgi:membrane protease subunit HflC